MDTNRGTEPRRFRSPIRPIEHEAHAGFESKKEDEEMRHRACCVETRSSPDLLGANVRALTFYLGNPFPRFPLSLLKYYAGAIADVMVSNGTIAKCSVPFSSDETISDVFLVEKLTKSRCGTSKTRPEAVSIFERLVFGNQLFNQGCVHSTQMFSLRVCASTLRL
jgi:hypothetical protein